MVAVLDRWYPGDRALDFLLIVALGVALLSTAAWVVAAGLRRKPAARHLVLLSALLCCLAMPALAALVAASGWALVAIPILPAGAEASVRGLVRGGAGAATSSLYRDTAMDPRPASIPAGPAGSLRPAPATTVVGDPTTPASTPAIDRPGPTIGVRAEPAAGLHAGYRGLATLALFSWACGSLVLLIRFAASCRRIRRLRDSARPHRDSTVRRMLEDVGARLGSRRLPRVLISRQVATPLAIGFLRPVVMLPEKLLTVASEEELRDVLVHEVAHIVRRDHLVVLLQELAGVQYWPIVPVHGLNCELGRAREELCDNHVLQGRDAVSYGENLLHLAELSMHARPLRAAGILHWRGELERRIAGFLDQGRSTMTRNHRGLACLVALLFVAGSTIASATRFIAAQTQAQTPAEAKRTAPAEAKPQEPARRTMLVHAVGPDGKPMAGVKIHRSVWTRPLIKDANRDFVTDDRGEAKVDLPGGMSIFRLWARADHHVPLFAHWEEEDNPEKNLPADFTFRLMPGTTIGGIVRNTEGQPIKGVAVEVRLDRGGRGDGTSVPDTWLAEQEPTTHTITVPMTDEQGRWTLDNVPPGDGLELKLKLGHPDYISDAEWGAYQEAQGVDLKALRARTAAITMRGGLVASGTVTDPAGKPVAGAVVVRGDRPYWEWGSQEVRTDEQGRYRFPPLPAGPLTVTVVAPGWMPALRKVEIRQGMTPFDFRLAPGKELQIRFVDAAGKPVPRVGVGIENWRGGESLYNHKHPNVLDTGIPTRADDQGLYRWTWAPGDAVTYRLHKEGFAEHTLTLTAGGGEQKITLSQVLRITGKIADAATGRSIPHATAIPVLEFAPGHLVAERDHAREASDGTYAIEADRTDVAYRVRVEAEGYRSAMSDAFRAGASNPTFDFRLDAAPPLRGRVVDAQGNPVKEVRAYLVTSSQILMGLEDDSNGSSDQKVRTDGQGRFSFPAQFERYAIVAAHDRGYAEVSHKPDEQPGELVLRAWASVEGRLVQAGRPVPGVWVTFGPSRVLGGGSPHIQDNTSVKTDRDGRFEFPRVPPVISSVRAHVSVWRDSPLSSGQSIPLDLQPGQRYQVELGGQGTQVKGRVVLSGDAAPKIDIHKSLNWLLRRSSGVEPPPELRSLGLAGRDGWNDAWTTTPEGLAYLQTRPNYLVILDKDGRFQVSGVPAGDYDLALRLYEPPSGGCLVSPVGSRIVRFHVGEEAARGAEVDLGDIPVKVALGPRVGDTVPDLSVRAFSGETVSLSDLRGRYVLLDFWATWCAPCVANLPALDRLHETFGGDKRLAILGLNLDGDPARARRFVAERKLAGIHASLGDRPDEQDQLLTRYAVGSVPAYILIGQDGKLLHRGSDIEEVGAVLKRSLR
jgi:beta-lactamase regulating signal transducer with metallopeptidase domain/thiol-disulfide isomerase/thioredoxin/protocatechuate 3,4-dioxygenase beta subunit